MPVSGPAAAPDHCSRVPAEPEGWGSSGASSQRHSSSQARVRGPAFHVTRIRGGVRSSPVPGAAGGCSLLVDTATLAAFAHRTLAPPSIVAASGDEPPSAEGGSFTIWSVSSTTYSWSASCGTRSGGGSGYANSAAAGAAAVDWVARNCN